MSDPVGFNIKRPTPDVPGDSLIFITRPSSGPFGTAGTAIFAVSDVFVYEHYVEASSPTGRIMFSKDLPFLMVPRAHTTPITTKEMAELQLREKKEWDEVFEADEAAGVGDLTAVATTPDGRMKHDAQGYL